MVSQTVLMDLMKKNVVSKMHIFSNDPVDNSNCEKSGSEAFMNHSCLPEHGWFSCLSKGTQKCMPISRACDGYADCDDRTDEGGQCSKFQALCYHYLAINIIMS
jgi:hypothetical protein